MNNIPKQIMEGNSIPPPIISVKNPGRLSKIIVILMVILIVLGIIGVGTALALRVWDPIWNPFRPNPEKVMSLMLEKMLAVKSAHSDSKMTLEMKGQNPAKAVITFNGDWDKDINNPKMQVDYGISLTGGIGDPTITNSVKFSIKMVTLNEGYFNVAEVNASSLTPFLMMAGIDLDNIMGNWIKIPIDNQFGQNNNAQTAALTEQVKKILSESKIYIIKKQLPDQIINGQKMYHYLVVLDNDKAAKLIGDLMNETMKQFNQNQTVQESSMLLASGAVKGIVSEFLNKIGEISTELSIGKNNNLLYGFKLEKSIDLAKIDSRLQGVGSVSIETTSSKFDQPVVVEAPAIFKNFDEAFPQYKNTEIENSMAKLRNEIESIYIKDGSFLNISCQNESIKPYCDQMNSISGTEVIIHQSKNYYCAYIQLPISKNKEANYFCIDISGTSHETTINPGKKGYCIGKTYICP